MFGGHNRTRFQPTVAILIITNLQEATLVGMAIQPLDVPSARRADQSFNPPLVGMAIESSKRLNPHLNWLPETNFVNLENVALETVTTGGLTIPETAQT